MNYRAWLLGSVIFVSACAPTALRPTVQTLPGRDKSFVEFHMADSYCRDRATEMSRPSPASQQALNTAKSAAVTGALGAGVGAIIGAVTGSVETGAAIGGASGLALGAAGGAGAGHRGAQALQQAYDDTYRACMYGSGMQVSGQAEGFIGR